MHVHSSTGARSSWVALGLLTATACQPAISNKGSDSGTEGEEDSPDPWSGPNEVAPGTFVSTAMWAEGGVRCSRLAQLALQDGGDLSAWSWTFCQDAWGGYADVVPIGASEQDAPAEDAAFEVQSHAIFIGQEPTLREGHWDALTDTAVELSWEDGSTERWARTWTDETLDKLELFQVSAADAPTDTWLQEQDGAFARDEDATVLGVAFGGPEDPGLEVGLDGLDDYMETNYFGRFLRWNGYYTAPDDALGVNSDELGLSSFYLTDTGVARYVYGGDGGGMYIFCYLALPEDREGLRTRQIVYQTSHDFDNDGNIADGPGHVYAGLQIVDATGTFRGVVFADQSYDTGVEAVMILSSMYYLDVSDDAAHSGTGD